MNLRTTITGQNSRVTRSQLYYASIALALVLFGGSGGYYALGEGQWSLIDCVYMTVITMTTVGYSEVLPVHSDFSAKVFTLVLITWRGAGPMSLDRLLGEEKLEHEEPIPVP